MYFVCVCVCVCVCVLKQRACILVSYKFGRNGREGAITFGLSDKTCIVLYIMYKYSPVVPYVTRLTELVIVSREVGYADRLLGAP